MRFHAGWRPEPLHFGLMFASGMVHTAYFLLLDRAYRAGGDLSIVYPLARATGPLLTIAFAVAMLGERPGLPAIAGALLIGASALLLAGNPFSRSRGLAGRCLFRKGRDEALKGFLGSTSARADLHVLADLRTERVDLAPCLVV